MKRDKAYKGKSWDVKNQLVKLIDRVIPPPISIVHKRVVCLCLQVGELVLTVVGHFRVPRSARSEPECYSVTELVLITICP